MDVSSILEYSATLFGVIYIILLTKTKPIAWLFGLLSSLILFIIYLEQQIYLQAGLNLYYVIIAVYAYFLWSNPLKELPITRLSIKQNMLYTLGVLVVFVILYIIINHIIIYDLALIDTFIFVFSIYATYLQACKILDNWYYWIILNIISCVLLYQIDLYPLVILMLAYLLFAIYGLYAWKKGYAKQGI